MTSSELVSRGLCLGGSDLGMVCITIIVDPAASPLLAAELDPVRGGERDDRGALDCGASRE